MSCFPVSNESPYARLMLACSSLQAVQPGADVSESFAQFRALLWEVIEVAPDPNSCVLAWNTIDQFAKADLAEYQATGNGEALERLKYKVNYALELLP